MCDSTVRLKLYPLSQAGRPPETKFVDAADVVFDSTIRCDLKFFESLNKIGQAEPWLECDKAMIDPLKTVGIERGKPFNPNAQTQQILNEAIKEAKVWLDERLGTMPPYYEDGDWCFPATEEFHQNIISFFKTSDSYPIDNRGVIYSLGFFNAKHLGESQYYLMTTSDSGGRPLESSVDYRLNVPASVPVHQYWSMTVCNRETHAFIRNARWPGESSFSWAGRRQAG